MSAFVVVMSDHKHPRYHVARKMIGSDSYIVISTSMSEYYARSIATAMSAAEIEKLNAGRKIVPIKQVRKRA
jgi:hypothetical protein